MAVSASARATAWDKGQGQHLLEEKSVLWRGWVRLSLPLVPLLPSPPGSVGAVTVWLLVAVRKLRTGQAS